MRLSTKIILLILAVTLVLGTGSSFLATRMMLDALEAELRDQAVFAARSLADHVAHNVVAGEAVEARSAVTKMVESSQNIRYAYVIGFDGRVFAHSFEAGLPEALAGRAHRHEFDSARPPQPVHLETGMGCILDIAYPLIEGRPAHVHIGMDEERVHARIGSLRNEILGWTLLLAAVCTLIGIFVSRRMMQPLTRLANAMRDFGEGKGGGVLKLRSGGLEMANLMRVFNRMTSERRQTMDALRESRRMLQLVLDSIPVRVFWKDRDSVYLGCNRHFAEDAGLESPEQIIGKNDFELGWREQAELYRADDRQVMHSGEPKLNYEEPQTGPDGSHLWLRTSKVPLRDLDGNIFGVMGVYEDITGQKELEEALRRAQKMEAIGRLSGGIAHDFNNQLGVIIGYLDFLKNRFPEDDKSRHWVDTAIRATLRCTDLTRQLLAFSRRQAKEKMVVDLNALLKNMQTMIARSVTPEVEVQYFLSDDLKLTEINPGEFQDAVLNLVINARDAMPDGGKLLIETANKHLDAGYVALNPWVEPGDYVQLALSDTGVGMSAETLEHIFEPFFTTKPEGKGTGLGLAMVYGFVKRYGGNIKVYSEPGVGTTIRLYLPCSQASGPTIMVENGRAAELPTGDETILIVDDEADLLQLADQYLTGLGYHTRLAGTAAQALDILAEDDSIDLLFSDVVMPGGMNGYELAQEATRRRPGLKVLLTSGFTSKTIASNGLARFSAHLLGKPYRKADLAQRIRLVLDEEPAA
ncbi:MAG TPA: PAS domain-containing sensor histidine kinase [Sedimenticola sp.]|nr:PAS domain-containing sensor histidine kinase [Sedimenticola sp.]